MSSVPTRGGRDYAKLRSDPEKWETRKAYNRQWRKNNPGRTAKHARKRDLRAKYGITPEQFLAMVEKQEGRCAICTRTRLLHVDHRHSDGKVRELLCFKCNAGIGQLEDNPELLRAAALYLERHA